MAKIIIIGDLHNRVDWVEPFLAGQTYDKVIFLGDYMDNWGDNANDASKTARWIKKMLADDRYILCWGNHDLSYAFPKNEHLWCPGFDHAKSEAVNGILKLTDWAKLKLVHFEDDFVFCHGGIHPHWFCHPIHGITKEYIIDQCDKAMACAREKIYNPILSSWGPHRGDGRAPGGIVWADWHEVEPLDGLKQIVGHTPGVEPRIKKWELNGTIKSYCACLDVIGNTWYATIENGVFAVHKNPMAPEYKKKRGKKAKSGMTSAGYGICNFKELDDDDIDGWIEKIK